MQNMLLRVLDKLQCVNQIFSWYEGSWENSTIFANGTGK